MPVAKLKVSLFFRLLVGFILLAASDFHLGSVPARSNPNSLPNARMSSLPTVMLWSWERPDDLTFVDPQRAGIAFLAGTLRLEGESAIFRPRLNSIRFPRGIFLMACVRIESDRNLKPSFSDAQRAQAVSAIAHAAALRGVRAIQVDFDARVSERGFYTALLTDLSDKVPADTPISMTALASWCLGDDWVSDLPVQEAVPMLFRMGADRSRVISHLESGGDFRSGLCRASLGLSTDEPISNLPQGRRIYLFNTGPWTEAGMNRALARLGVN
jgi:hypothetical protein